MSAVHAAPRAKLEWSRRDSHPALTAMAVVGAIAFLGVRVFDLPSFDLHTPLHYAEIMDPFCGMTRAMWLLGHARLDDAWHYNPGAYALAIGGGFLVVRAVVGSATRRWLTLRGLSRRFVWIVVAVAVTALWINQQANADLLMTGGLR